MQRLNLVAAAFVLCVITTCAFAAPGASAAWYTCKAVTPMTGHFIDSHCTSGGPGGNWDTVKVTTLPTDGKLTATGSATITATIAGISTEVVCSELNGSVKMTGEKTEGEVSWVLSGCEVKQPSENGCKVREGKITTTNLKTTAVKDGEGKEVTTLKSEPESGTTFAPIVLEGCKVGLLNGEKLLTGSITAEISPEAPAKRLFTKTSGSALKLGGNAATLTVSSHVVMEGTDST